MQARRLDKGLCDDEARQIYKTLIRICQLLHGVV
jgi:hypothetical protein